MNPAAPVFPHLADSLDDRQLDEVEIAKTQEQYRTLPALYLYGQRCVVSRWVLDERERQTLLHSRRLRFFKWAFNERAQPSLLLIDPPDPDREPAPDLWEHVDASDEQHPGVILCHKSFTVEEAERIRSQGYIFMLVWNVFRPLMPTCLQVEEEQ